MPGKLFFSLLFFSAHFLFAQETLTNPVAYFDFFNQEHGALAQKNMEYLQYAVHSDDLQLIAEKRLALLLQVNATQERMANVPDFSNDGGLKLTMKEVLDTYAELFEVGFEQVEALKIISQESFAQMERYLAAQTAAEERMATASAKLLAAQRRFAAANGISLMEEPGAATEAEQLNALNEYQRAIFLRSFRVGKLNADFLLAMNANDGEAIEAVRQDLISACAEEIPVIKKHADFKGNTAYRDAVLAQMNILQKLAKEDYPAIVKVVKKGDQITAEDVEAYNQAIGKVNGQLNPAAEQINTALQNLLRANVPKPAVRGIKQI